MVGAPVWPNGVTLAAEAAFTVTAEATSAAAPVSILRRSRPPPLPSGWRKVSGVVMISSHGFCWEEIHVPATRHKAGGVTNLGRHSGASRSGEPGIQTLAPCVWIPGLRPRGAEA